MTQKWSAVIPLKLGSCLLLIWNGLGGAICALWHFVCRFVYRVFGQIVRSSNLEHACFFLAMVSAYAIYQPWHNDCVMEKPHNLNGQGATSIFLG